MIDQVEMFGAPKRAAIPAAATKGKPRRPSQRRLEPALALLRDQHRDWRRMAENAGGLPSASRFHANAQAIANAIAVLEETMALRQALKAELRNVRRRKRS
ncbi:MAG: hypothetical protein KBC46_03380 [Ferrovibrio sp.]|nr:hypothetical protein [Ferrovibrio sp.]